MYFSLIYWLILLLPGYAAMRWFAPKFVEGGLPGAIAVSMLATFALLSPVNILGHVFGAPLWVLSATIIALVVGAVVLISIRKWWRALCTLLLAGLCIELTVVAIEMVFAARYGSGLLGDAHTHLSRIRFIIDEGMSNGHPFYDGQYFFPTYHTNIWHSMLACGSQLTGLRTHDIWFTALPVATLLIVCGIWQLAWTVFQRQWPAWVAALFALGAFGSVPFLTYPNKLAPLWLMPLLLAFVIQAIQQPKQWRTIALIAASSLVLGQVHGLYVLLTLLIAGPVLAIAIVFRSARKELRPALLYALAGIALAVGMSFPVYSARQTDTLEKRISAFADPEEGDRVEQSTDESSSAKNAKRTSRYGKGFTGKPWRMPLVVIAGIVIILLNKSARVPMTIMLGCFVINGFWLWIPLLYDTLVNALGGGWVVARMELFFRVAFFVIVAGGVTSLLDLLVRPGNKDRVPLAPWRIVNPLAMLIAASLFSPQNLNSWKQFREANEAPASQRLFRLHSLHALQDLALTEIPPDAHVLSPPALGQILTSLVDCQIIYAFDNNAGAGNRNARRIDLDVLLSGATRPNERSDLLHHYSITHGAFVGEPPRWASRKAATTQSAFVPLLGNNVTIVRFADNDQ